MLEGVRRLLPSLARHAAAYAALISAEAESAAAAVKRRVVLGVTAFLIGWLSVALGIVWIVAAAWDTPWRMWLIGGLCIGLAIIAVAVALVMMREDDEPFRRVRAEWAADREMFRRIGSRLTEDRHA